MTYYRNKDRHKEVFRISESGEISKRVVDTEKKDGEIRTVFKYYNSGQLRYHKLDSADELEEVSPEEVGTHKQLVSSV